MNLKHKKHEENCTKLYHNQMAHNQYKDQILKGAKMKKYIQRNKDKYGLFPGSISENVLM